MAFNPRLPIKSLKKIGSYSVEIYIISNTVITKPTNAGRIANFAEELQMMLPGLFIDCYNDPWKNGA